MRQTDEIVKAALLGTDKYFPKSFNELGDFAQRVTSQNTDKEDQFLKLAFASFLSEEAGDGGFEFKSAFPICPIETKQRVNDKISREIEKVISSKDDVILEYLVYECNKRDLVSKLQMVPWLLDKSLHQKKMRTDLLKFSGETGKWLCQLNEDWHALVRDIETEDVWENGSPASRKQYFLELRKVNPDAARELAKTIYSESATIRAEYVELLNENLSLNDEEFLTQFTTDKSAKVRQVAYHFLKRIDGSKINALLTDYAIRAMSLKEERFKLVFKKKALVFNENVIPTEEMFASGLEKMSNQKGLSDFHFWLQHTITYVNPTKLAKGLGCTELELISAFLELKEKEVFLVSLFNSTINFKNKIWAKELLKNDSLGFGLLSLLDEAERIPHYKAHIEASGISNCIEFFCKDNYNTLDDNIAILILEKLRANSYHEDASGYKFLALHLSPKMIPEIERLSQMPNEDYNTRHFKNLSIEMIRIIDLRRDLLLAIAL